MTRIVKKLLPLLLLACLGTLAASPLSEEFEQRVRATKSAEEGLVVINEYAQKMTDLEDLRVLQNYWMRADKGASQQHFADLHDQQPDSPVYHYLWLRGSESLLQQLRGGRQLTSRFPDFYWGYRLFSSTYSQALLDNDAPADLQQDIRDNLDKDLKLLKKGLKSFGDDSYLLLALYHLHNTKEDYNEAEKALLRLRDPQAIEMNFQIVLDFITKTKRSRAFEALYPQLLSLAISEGKVKSADSLYIYQQNYLYALSLTEEWGRMHAYLDRWPQLKEDDDTLPLRVDMHLGLGQLDTALNLLEGAMARDVLDVKEVEKDPKYEVLKSQPRYQEVMDNALRNWEQGREKRRQLALKSKISKPAPLWELPQADSTMVRLENQRGKIVVLDFWATWCKPCLKTMPLLDAWFKENAAPDLAVFSINTWQSPSDLPQVLEYVRESGYSMTLLLGNNELPKAYGFTGIPYICVIDKQGNIAYEQSGYRPDLPELLDFWLEDLRR